MATIGAARPVEAAPSASTEQTPRPDCGEPAGADDPNIVDGVIVEGRERGSTQTPITPELVLDEEAIGSYGAGSIAELMAQIEPLTRSSRGDGPPIRLINGQRTASEQETGAIPTEALLKIEILPEEASLAYGYPATQKLVNFKLKNNFKAWTDQAERRWDTDGGRAAGDVRATLFKVDDKTRRTLDLRYAHTSPLYEQERNIVRDSGAPYDLRGNVVGAGADGEIDPALSALAGSLVSIAAVPASAADGAPDLADFAAGAGRAATDDLTASQTLLPRVDEGSIQGTYSRNFGPMVTTTFSGALNASNNVSHLGLPTAMLSLPAGNPFSPFAQDVVLYRYFDMPDAMRRTVETRRAEVGIAAQGMARGFNWTFVGAADRSSSDTRTARGLDLTAFRAAVAAGDPAVNPFGAIPADLLRRAPDDTARSTATNAKAELILAGPLAELPAGRLRVTVKAAFDSREIESESLRSGVADRRDLVRNRATAQSSLDLPLTRRDGGPLAKLGDVSLRGDAQYERISDIGGLVTASGGVSWSPLPRLTLTANYGGEQREPTPQQLGDPVMQTPNRSMYDLATGQTVIVTVTEGGNPHLVPDSRRVTRLSLNYKPFAERSLSFSGSYTATRIDNQIASFPAVSPELEAAFPDRFTRDAEGRLTAVDTRPVNLAHADTEELRWGLFYSKRWGGPPPTTKGAPARKPPPGGSGYLQVTFNHTWRLRNEVVIRDGLAPLDLLGGASLGRAGGAPRHEANLQANLAKDGMGLVGRMSWKAATVVDGGASGDDIHFDALSTVSLSGFASLGNRRTWVKRYPQLKGVMLTLGVENLFNAKPRVRDAQGRTPQTYQKDYLDKVGRQISLRLRKQF
ncbi:MAG: TonB-dependent receptor [Caulobacter sp.]